MEKRNTIAIMTEESDENEDGELIMHELTWRLQVSLN